MRALGSGVAALPPILAILATLVGAGAMFAGGTLLATAAPGLDLRLHIFVGTVLLALPTVILLLGLRRGVLGEVLALGRPGSRAVGLSVLFGGALWILSIGLIELQSMVWPPPTEYIEAFRAIHRALAPDDALDALVSVTVIALAPAIGEEVMTRGVLLPSLLRWVSPFGAVVGSAVLFALIHLDPYRFAFTLMVGLALGALRLVAGSLWPPIVAHASLNTLTFLVAPLVDDPSQTTYTTQPLLGVGALVAGAVVAFPLLKALRRPGATEPVPAPGPLE